MKRRSIHALRWAFLLASGFQLAAQQKLTLQQAEQIALRSHPRIASSGFSAEAIGRGEAEVKSAYYPTASLNITATAANDMTTLAAGNLQTSSLNSRFASGISIVQLVTDFGRTNSLVNAARFRYQAASDNVLNVRAQILLEVRRAYFNVLGADSVLTAARATLQTRQLVLRQVTALTQSSLRSTLDETFSQVLVSEAQLAVDQAENDLQSSRAALSAALGSEAVSSFDLDDQPLPDAPGTDAEQFVTEALKNRPDLNLLRHNRDAASQFAQAEKKLSNPTISVAAAAGAIPEHDHTIPRDNYEAAGVNINFPVFNGGLFTARRTEADLRVKAADKDVEDMSIRVARDVRIAWLNANSARRRLQVTAQLVEQARKAVHLAQARYDAGLGSIVELNQAQLSELSAEINGAAAKYDYLSRRTELDFADGELH